MRNMFWEYAARFVVTDIILTVLMTLDPNNGRDLLGTVVWSSVLTLVVVAVPAVMGRLRRWGFCRE